MKIKNLQLKIMIISQNYPLRTGTWTQISSTNFRGVSKFVQYEGDSANSIAIKHICCTHYSEKKDN